MHLEQKESVIFFDKRTRFFWKEKELKRNKTFISAE